MRRHLLACAAVAALTHVAARRADACTFHGTASVVTYWTDKSPYDPVRANDMRCDPLAGGKQSCHLAGTWVVPTTTMPTKGYPTVVFVHGSGNPQGGYCGAVNELLDRGFAVYYPVMRGVSLTDGTIDNTGQYVVDWATAQNAANPSRSISQYTIDGMNDEILDIDSAMRTVITFAHVDTTKLALMGHSYGGVVVTLSAGSTKLTVLPNVAVSLSGAAMSYQSGNAWAQAMVPAAAAHQVPIYFQRVINESPQWTLDSAVEPYNAAVAAGGGARLAAYSEYDTMNPSSPPCDDADYHVAHCAFISEADGIARWMDGVVEFLADYGVK